MSEARSRSDHLTAAGPSASEDLALVLTGGTARGAYQAGVLRGLARRLPELRFPIITGVSAGAINASFLATHPGTFREAAEDLCEIWLSLQVEDIFRVDTISLARHFTRWAARLASGGMSLTPDVRGMVDTRPLHSLIQRWCVVVDDELLGIQRNLERGTLKAFALTALNYSTEQTVTWVQARDFHPWNQPRHRGVSARITVEHVMASSALPLFFPAIRIGTDWYGDGGIRLSTPLAPALRLGATRILAISPHREPVLEPVKEPRNTGYPPPARILSHLMGAIFLDVVDEDVRRLEGINFLLAKMPREAWGELRNVDIRTVRPSQPLGPLAAAYEPRLPAGFRYLTRSLGTREADGLGSLSFLMFQPDYLQCILEIGEADAEAHLDDLRSLLAPG